MKKKNLQPSVLHVKPIATGGVQFQLEPLMNKHDAGWLSLLMGVAQAVFTNKPLCVLASANPEDVWDVDLAQHFPRISHQTIEQYPYQLAFQPAAKPDTLRMLMNSEALYLQPLWLFCAGERQAADVIELARQKINANQADWSLSSLEFMETNPDGDVGYWHNPVWPAAQIQHFFEAHARQQGWHLHAIA